MVVNESEALTDRRTDDGRMDGRKTCDIIESALCIALRGKIMKYDLYRDDPIRSVYNMASMARTCCVICELL